MTKDPLLDSLFNIKWRRRVNIALKILIGLIICKLLWMSYLQTLHQPVYVLYRQYITYNASMVSKQSITSETSTAPIAVQLKNDSHILLNLTNFKYLMNHSCGNATMPNAVILIHSDPTKRSTRDAIRESYGQVLPAGNIFFLMGAVDNATLQAKIEKENNKTCDIIQGNFHESYRNMTYKHTMGLKWFADNCPKWKFLIKADDDVLINTLKVFDFLESGAVPKENLIFCSPVKNEPINRNKFSKWYVSKKDFPSDIAPTYCFGWVIVYSNDVVPKLYREVSKLPYHFIDDVQIIGFARMKANLNITTNSKYLVDNYGELISGKVKFEDLPNFLFAAYSIHKREIVELWKMLLASNSTSNGNVTKNLGSFKIFKSPNSRLVSHDKTK